MALIMNFDEKVSRWLILRLRQQVYRLAEKGVTKQDMLLYGADAAKHVVIGCFEALSLMVGAEEVKRLAEATGAAIAMYPYGQGKGSESNV